MKKLCFLICGLFLLNMTCIAQTENVLMLYVSVEGSDASDGSIGSPFATIEKAQEAIRNLKEYPSGGVCVSFREGEYKISKTIRFEQKDSGKENAPVIYRAYPNEKVSFSGLKDLCYKDFTEVNDQQAKSKISKDILGKMKQMDLSKTDVDLGKLFHYGQDYTAESSVWSELVFDGEIMDLARYPNDKKYLYVEETLTNGAEPDVGSQWKSSDELVKTLEGETDLWTMGWFIWHWTTNFEKVKSVSSDGVIESAVPIKTHGTVRVSKNMPYYLVNSLKLIDIPGEYYIDRDKKMLYFYPPKDVANVKVGLTSLKDNMIEMKNVSGVTFENITFENGRAIGIETRDCKNIIVDGCTIQNFATNAANFWGSLNCQVINSEVYNIGSRAVNVEGGNAENLTSCGFRLVNNEIHKLGRINKTQATAIWGHGYNGGTVGVYAAYNKMYNMPFQVGGFSMNGIMEYNEIFDCANESADMGAVYMGGTFISGRGVKIRYNYIHDIPCNFIGETGYGTNGIYLDIDACGYEVYGNVVANVHRNMYYSSCGGYNKVYNNVFIGNKNAESIKEFPTSAQTIRVIGSGAGDDREKVKARFKPYAYQNEIWLKTFPEVAEAIKKEYPLQPSHKINNNIMYNCMEMSICDETFQDPYTEIKNNWIKDTDPGFVDLAGKNYQLRSDAPVLKELPDFKIVDMQQIGLRKERVSSGAETVIPDVQPPAQDADVASKVKNALVLKVDSNYAIQNGTKVEIEVPPVIIDDRTFVPLRYISEAFGARVGWNESTQQAAIVDNDTVVIFKLGSNIIKINDTETQMDTAAQTVRSRTMIPLRALAEALGKKVFWDDRGIIIISGEAYEADGTFIEQLIQYMQ